MIVYAKSPIIRAVAVNVFLIAWIGVVSADNYSLEMIGDFKVNTSISPGTPNFITGNNGDAYIKDQLEVDGNTNIAGYLSLAGTLAVDSSVLYVNASTNQVGIGTSSIYDKLGIQGGAIGLYELASHPSDDTVWGKVYAKTTGGLAEVFAMDGYGDYAQLSSHANPSVYNSTSSSSFDDLEVILPFSFHHGNKYIGKGAVVDLAGLVKEAETRFGKSFTSVYDLPTGETDTITNRRERLELRTKERILAETPEIEISIQEAWENAEVQEPVETTRSITKYRYDLKSEQVIPFQVEEKVIELAGTGLYERQLKEGVRFDESTGKFYRQRTLDEVELPPDAVPPLPDWILSRIPAQGK